MLCNFRFPVCPQFFFSWIVENVEGVSLFYVSYNSDVTANVVPLPVMFGKLDWLTFCWYFCNFVAVAVVINEHKAINIFYFWNTRCLFYHSSTIHERTLICSLAPMVYMCVCMYVCMCICIDIGQQINHTGTLIRVVARVVGWMDIPNNLMQCYFVRHGYTYGCIYENIYLVRPQHTHTQTLGQ